MHFGASRFFLVPQWCVRSSCRAQADRVNALFQIDNPVSGRNWHDGCCIATYEDETQPGIRVCFRASCVACSAIRRRRGDRERSGLGRRSAHSGIRRRRQRADDRAVGRAPGPDSSPRARSFGVPREAGAGYILSRRRVLPDRIFVRSSRERGRSAIHFVPGGFGTKG